MAKFIRFCILVTIGFVFLHSTGWEEDLHKQLHDRVSGKNPGVEKAVDSAHDLGNTAADWCGRQITVAIRWCRDTIGRKDATQEKQGEDSAKAEDTGVEMICQETSAYTRPVNEARIYNWESLFRKDGEVRYEDEAWHSRFGIDVSYHNKTINWEKVRDAGVEFAIIRLGYRGYKAGNLYEDEQFRANIEGASAAGIDVGVYFYTQALDETEAREEAVFVMNALEGYEIALPVFYDTEEDPHYNSRMNGISREQATANAAAFCEVITEAGYDAGIYSGEHWENRKLDMSVLNAYTHWYANYNSVPASSEGFTFLQYSAHGSVPGIKGNDVDLNMEFVKN